MFTKLCKRQYLAFAINLVFYEVCAGIHLYRIHRDSLLLRLPPGNIQCTPFLDSMIATASSVDIVLFGKTLRNSPNQWTHSQQILPAMIDIVPWGVKHPLGGQLLCPFRQKRLRKSGIQCQWPLKNQVFAGHCLQGYALMGIPVNRIEKGYVYTYEWQW